MINKFSILNGAKYFSSGVFQNYLVFIPAKKYTKCFSSTTSINLWKSNGMSEENIVNLAKSDCLFIPTFVMNHALPEMNFNEHRLINNNISILKKVIYIYIYIYIYFLHTKTLVKRYKCRFYITYFLIWMCKSN